MSHSLLCAMVGTLLILGGRARSAAYSRSRCGHRGIRAAVLLFAVLAARLSLGQNTIYVTTTQQGATDPFNCSLQEAIYAANFDQAIAIDTTNPDHFYGTGCVAGSGNDTIALQAGAVYPMSAVVDDAHNPTGPTATPIIFTNITIEANGATLQKQGSTNLRAFAVAYRGCIDLNAGTSCDAFNPPANAAFGFGNLTIKNAYITGFTAKGGDGASGGGGGMGAGGAIYTQGSLTIDSCTFEGNGAIGGNGSFENPNGPGGGGGGVGGNGGIAQGDQTGLVEGGTGAGGGGGGARGDGGANGFPSKLPGHPWASGAGGGGGGTVTSGTDFIQAGFDCGGAGGASHDDGNDAVCDGGGGGGGGDPFQDIIVRLGGDGGTGGYGGGGGGGGFANSVVSTNIFGRQGGGGGFGGGGGAGGADDKGGNGGFGGGGGAGGDTPGHGGVFAGAGTKNLDSDFGGALGGGGAALGGAIFSHGGNVIIQNSTFSGNFVSRGNGGGHAGSGNNGADAGGAIFAVDGTLSVLDSTISGNQSTGDGAGIVVYRDLTNLVTSLKLRNTIIANNSVRECFFKNGVTAQGSGNLIVQNFGCPGSIPNAPDPQLGPLLLNAPGVTKTFELLPGSPAIGVADAATSLPVDQRGSPRKPAPDIGAYETPAPAADLSLSKAASPSTAQPGETITYTLTLTNLGPVAANNVTVTDSFPPALTFVSCTANGGGSCGFTGSAVTTTYATLAVNSPATISIQGTLNSGVQDNLQVVNTATASAASPDDPDTSNNTAAASFVVHNRADIVVTKQVSAATVLAGDLVTYTIHLSNAGPYDAKGISVSDQQPAGVTFNSCTSTIGTCNLSGGVASLNLAQLLNAASATITIQATLNFSAADGSTVTNTATASSSTFDPNAGNNSSGASFTVQNKSDLFITKKANLTSVKATQNLVYTVTVKNLGPYRAAAVVMNDPTPPNSGFVSLTSGGVSCTAPAVGGLGTIACNIGNMANGATATFTITVHVGGATNKASISNTATANSPNFDPNLANNTATATTQIYGNKK